MGRFQSCMLDPSTPCPDAELGASSLEEALNGNGFSSLRLEQGQGGVWEWERGKALTSRADMDFKLLLATPMRSVLGFALYSPWPSQEWTRWSPGQDSVRMYEVQPSSNLSVFLGWDLLAFRTSRDQQLLFLAELPVAYEPGVWKAQLEYLPGDDYRIRASYAQSSPREEIAHWNNQDDVFKLKYKERRYEGQLAARLFQGPEVAIAGRYTELTPRTSLGAFSRSGDVWGVSGQLLWLGRFWAWRNEFDAEYRDILHSYVDAAQQSALTWNGAYDLYRFKTRLQRTFFRVARIGLHAERRLALGAPSAENIQGVPADSTDWLRATYFQGASLSASRLSTELYGGDLRWWFSGLYVEAGGDYAYARRSGTSSPFLTWGDTLDFSQALPAESVIMRLGAGFQADGANYLYSYRRGYALGHSEPLMRYAGTHRFEISGRF